MRREKTNEHPRAGPKTNAYAHPSFPRLPRKFPSGCDQSASNRDHWSIFLLDLAKKTCWSEEERAMASSVDVNPCTEVGWSGHEIGSQELLRLWETYDVNRDGRLSERETITLFKDLGRTLGIPIRKNKAIFLFKQHAKADPALGLTQDEYLSMFVVCSAIAILYLFQTHFFIFISLVGSCSC